MIYLRVLANQVDPFFLEFHLVQGFQAILAFPIKIISDHVV
jgi:hypothetical protein